MQHKIESSNIEEIMRIGENESIEFKTGVPHPNILAKHIAAFANSFGGTILFGVDERNGVSEAAVIEPLLKKNLEIALKMLTPQPKMDLYEIIYKDCKIIALDVEKFEGDLVLTNGAVLVRENDIIRTMSKSEILNALKIDKKEAETDEKLNKLLQIIEKLNNNIEEQSKSFEKTFDNQKEVIEKQSREIQEHTGVIRELRNEMDKQNSFGSKLKNDLRSGTIGAILGTALGTAVTLLFLS